MQYVDTGSLEQDSWSIQILDHWNGIRGVFRYGITGRGFVGVFRYGITGRGFLEYLDTGSLERDSWSI